MISWEKLWMRRRFQRHKHRSRPHQRDRRRRQSYRPRLALRLPPNRLSSFVPPPLTQSPF